MVIYSQDGQDTDVVLSAAARGEPWALTGLFRTYQPLLVRYLRACDPGVADDLAGDVWVDVARRVGEFVGDERGFRAWLFTIARSRVLGHRRKVRRRRTDQVPNERLDGPSASPGGDDPATLVIDRMSAQDAVEHLVRDLSPDQAEVVLLRVVGGFDVAEVARILDRTPGSVRVLCHRALRRLATTLSEGVATE